MLGVARFSATLANWFLVALARHFLYLIRLLRSDVYKYMLASVAWCLYAPQGNVKVGSSI